MSYLLLILGFALLIKGADFFVMGASGIARKFKIPSMIIGLTIVAMGTSMPEAAVSISAAIIGSNDIALGNVVGSNIFNLLIVVGVSAVIVPMAIKKSTLRQDYPIAVAVTVVLIAMCADTFWGAAENTVGRIDGIILLVLQVLFVSFMIRKAKRAQVIATGTEEGHEIRLSKSIITGILGLAGIIWGGDITVKAGSEIALAWGMSETLVGLTIMAIGTSLPELATSVVAVTRGENDIAIGNVLGSNIFNILFILGASAVVMPINIDSGIFIDLFVLLFITIIAFLLSYTREDINKTEGVLFILLYAAYMAYIIIRN